MRIAPIDIIVATLAILQPIKENLGAYYVQQTLKLITTINHMLSDESECGVAFVVLGGFNSRRVQFQRF